MPMPMATPAEPAKPATPVAAEGGAGKGSSYDGAGGFKAGNKFGARGGSDALVKNAAGTPVYKPAGKAGEAYTKRIANAHESLDRLNQVHQKFKDQTEAHKSAIDKARTTRGELSPEVQQAHEKARVELERRAQARADKPKSMADRAKASQAEASQVRQGRATQGIAAIPTGQHRGDSRNHIERIARGNSRDELFQAAQGAGVQHDAVTKKQLIEHLHATSSPKKTGVFGHPKLNLRTTKKNA